LAELRQAKTLKKIKFLKNTRLTICPLTDDECAEILRMAGIVASPGIPLP
jgi:predicted RNA-binding protein with PUA-like domain